MGRQANPFADLTTLWIGLALLLLLSLIARRERFPWYVYGTLGSIIVLAWSAPYVLSHFFDPAWCHWGTPPWYLPHRSLRNVPQAMRCPP